MLTSTSCLTKSVGSGVFPRLTPGTGSIDAHIHFLECHQPVTDHLVEPGQHGLDPLFDVDTLDHNGKILRQAKDVSGVQPTRLSKSLDSPQNGGTGQTTTSKQLHDRLIQGTTVVGVRLTDEYAEQFRLIVFQDPDIIGRERIRGRQPPHPQPVSESGSRVHAEIEVPDRASRSSRSRMW